MNKINEYIEKYIDYLRFERLLSLNTIDSYKRDIVKLVLFLRQNNISDLQEISNDDILNFLEHLYQSQSDRSVSRILSSIRSFYRYLLRSGNILISPFSHIKNPKVPRKDVNILNQAEISGFLENIAFSTYLELRDRTMFELLYSCGMRVSEIINLRLNDINIEESLIRFIGKGSKERITPVGETAKNFLVRYLDSSRSNIEREIKNDYVFLNSRGGSISRQGFWKILKKYAKKQNIGKNLYPHIFRHSFATHMLEEGADLRIVQELLVHSIISTTEIYTNLDKRHIKQSYFKHHPREKS